MESTILGHLSYLYTRTSHFCSSLEISDRLGSSVPDLCPVLLDKEYWMAESEYQLLEQQLEAETFPDDNINIFTASSTIDAW